MSEEERRRFKSLETLRAAAYTSFNDRRGYEWKLSLSIWTALAIFLAGLVQPVKHGEIFPLRGTCFLAPLVVVLCLLLVVLHLLFIYWASRANDIDKKIRNHFRDEMVVKMLKLPFSSELETQIKYLPWTHYPDLIQVFITLLLVIAAVLIFIVRAT